MHAVHRLTAEKEHRKQFSLSIVGVGQATSKAGAASPPPFPLRAGCIFARTHARCGYSIALRHEVGSILDRNNNADAGVDGFTARFGFLQRIAPFAPKPEPVAAFRSAIAISRYDRPEHKSSTASSGCDLPAGFEFVHARAVDDVALQPLPQFLSLIQSRALRCGVGVMTFEEKFSPYNPVLVHAKPTAVLD
jgi:hypothetical protein